MTCNTRLTLNTSLGGPFARSISAQVGAALGVSPFAVLLFEAGGKRLCNQSPGQAKFGRELVDGHPRRNSCRSGSLPYGTVCDRYCRYP